MLKMRYKYGFTLIEIMIVVAIISLLLAIAIPNFIKVKHNTNEKGAIIVLQTIAAAAESFRSSKVPMSYPLNLEELTSAIPPYIDRSVANATKAERATKGYYYNYVRVNVNRFTCTAQPAVKGTTGTRVFFVDESGIVRLDNAVGSEVE